ncbi:MAG: VacB/RNase II family 3'-5' exoribonuclease [Candidatus Paracaedibacteraceae bacterium]|nr:VacB/RNase II family 3'-5' exoribonuclease [Candidatus Paracaedibacteraceae bacterium]
MLTLRTEILKLLEKEQRFITKRELCLLLNIKGARRVELKRVLADLKSEGLYGKNKDIAETILQSIQKPIFSKTNNSPRSGSLSKEASPLQRSKASIGILQITKDGYWVESSHRRDAFPPIRCPGAAIEAAEKKLKRKLINNDVIYFKRSIHIHLEIEDIIGNLSEPKVFSLMCIQNYDVPFEFSDKAVQQANDAKLPPLGKRTDYRSIPLVTIDGEDSRDFDDAVWAEPDSDHTNKGGWRAIVAIADVAYYVRPGDELDKEAFDRGNSIYFADRVVPMLPEGLSNEMCSLKPNEDRACIAVEMVISATGNLKSYKFCRGLMRSSARLTYKQVQEAIDGDYTSVSKMLWDNVLEPLYGCYKSLRVARDQRGSLNLESIERKVIFDEDGKIKAIIPKPQQISNQLIEELMISANVSAAKALTSKKWPCLFRVHDKPDETRVENLKHVIQKMRIKVPKIPKMTPQGFNTILEQETPFKRLIHDLVLRSQAQAVYSPDNLGHFGLGLSHYAHFTSPIRRYADLQVHRALIGAFDLGDGGQDIIPVPALKLIGEHISQTERTAAQMEREVMDRYLVLHLEDYVGHTFTATIVGVTGAGIFFALDTSGAQGFLHKSRLPNDYFIFDEENHRYFGKRTKRAFQLGDTLTVVLDAADSRTSATTFSLPDSKLVRKKEYDGYKRDEKNDDNLKVRHKEHKYFSKKDKNEESFCTDKKKKKPHKKITKKNK